jgi:hypothetical protein
MALLERVRAAAAAPPLSELAAGQRAELERELAEATSLEDLPGKWQAALLEAEAHGSALVTSSPSARSTDAPRCCSAASRATT